MTVATPRSARPPDVDAEFLEHREGVAAMLRRDFPWLEPEDIYQEAWIDAVKLRQQGQAIDNLPALLRDKARQRAVDAARKKSALPVPTAGKLMVNRQDPSPPPDEVVELSIEAEIVRRIISELGPREAAIIKMRFDLGMSTLEIMRALGISRKRLDKTVSRIYRTVLTQMTADEAGETPLSRRQRSLLLWCLRGNASASQLEKARRQVEVDPACRAMLVRMRETVDRVAAVLPLPVLDETLHQRGVSVLDQLNHSSAALRDAITAAAPRAAGQSWLEPITGSVSTLGAAGAAKVVVICLSFGGGAAVCINAGVFGRDDPTPAAAAGEHPRSKPPKDERPAKVGPRAPTIAKRASAPAAKQTSNSAPPPKTNGPAPASPAPPGSEEFGLGTQGSQPVSHEPAPAPVDGGGEFTP